ncbi:MAG: hypothetical protein FWE95_10710, partial [Planctomycetaceae bacterium]|nr:hypothetical protein [Planctomycetaceae bacterium]
MNANFHNAGHRLAIRSFFAFLFMCSLGTLVNTISGGGILLAQETTEPVGITLQHLAIANTDAEINLSENVEDYNIIVIDADQLSDAALRGAIHTASTNGLNNLVVLRTTETQNKITLSGGELYIGSGNVTIVSLGEENLIIDANQQSRVFNIGSNATVTLAGLTLTNGSTTSYYGGGIYNSGTLTVAYSTVSGNFIISPTGGLGGGIYSSGTLMVAHSTVSGNSPGEGGVGGGIYNHGYNSSGTLTITDSLITENTAASCGGIYNYFGTATITNCTITGNSATSNDGGGISNCYGQLAVINSTISGNSASSSGGGIHNYYYYDDSMLTVTNCTIVGNSASIGGGISNYGVLTINNTIVAGNTGNNGADIYYSFGSLFGGNNLIGDGSGQSSLVNSINGNIVGTTANPINPGFVDAANGDYRLTASSPAIDKGNNAYVITPYDLDGNRRIAGQSVDIGAYEYQAENVWQGGTTGAWNDAANWSQGYVPLLTENAIIPAEITVTISANTTIGNVDCAGTLNVMAGTLTMRGTVRMTGELRTSSGVTLRVEGANADVIVSGDAIIDGITIVATDGAILDFSGVTELVNTNLYAQAGGVIKFPQLTTAAISSNNTVTWRSTGANS